MGIVEYEKNRLRQQEIEVRALVALSKSSTRGFQIKAENRLLEIAFPEDLAKKINNQQQFGLE